MSSLACFGLGHVNTGKKKPAGASVVRYDSTDFKDGFDINALHQDIWILADVLIPQAASIAVHRLFLTCTLPIHRMIKITSWYPLLILIQTIQTLQATHATYVQRCYYSGTSSLIRYSLIKPGNRGFYLKWSLLISLGLFFFVFISFLKAENLENQS